MSVKNILFNKKNNYKVIDIDNDFVYYVNNDNDIVIVNDIINVFDKDNDKVINDIDFDIVKEYKDKYIVKDNDIKVNDFVKVIKFKDIDFDFDNDIVKVIKDKDNVINDNDFVIIVNYDLYKINEYKLNKYFDKVFVFYEYDNRHVYCHLKDNMTLKYILSHLNYCFYDLDNLKSLNNFNNKKNRLLKLIRHNKVSKKTINNLNNSYKSIMFNKDIKYLKNYFMSNKAYYNKALLNLNKDFVNNVFKSFKGQYNDIDLKKDFDIVLNNLLSYQYKNKDNDIDIDFDLLQSNYKYKVNDIDFDFDIDFVIDNDKAIIIKDLKRLNKNNDNVNIKDNVFNSKDIVFNLYKKTKKQYYSLLNNIKIKEKVNKVYFDEHNVYRYDFIDYDKVIYLNNLLLDLYDSNKDIVNEYNKKDKVNKDKVIINVIDLYNDFINDTFINDYNYKLTLLVYNSYINKVNDIIKSVENVKYDKDILNVLNHLIKTIENKKEQLENEKNLNELYYYDNDNKMSYHNSIIKVNKIDFEKIAYDKNKNNFITID